MNRPVRTAAVAFAGFALAATGCSDPPRSVPDRAMAESVVRRLDDAFRRGDAVAWWGTFVGEGYLGDAFARDLKLIETDTPLQRRSRVVEFSVIGDQGVALVQTELTDPAPEGCALTEQRYLAVTATADGPRATLLTSVVPEARTHVSQRWTGIYACPACDFSVGSDALPRWLVVPGPPSLAGCAEMVTFHRLGSPLRLTVSVVHDPQDDDAPTLLEQLLARPDRPVTVTAGLPAGIRADEGVSGAWADLSDDGGETVQARLVTRRPPPQSPPPAVEIGYLMTVRGGDAALRAHRDEVDRLLASFMFQPTPRSASQIGLDSVHAHGGGRIEADNRYRNERFGVTCRGPAGWPPFVRADRGLFQVGFDCPGEPGHVKLTGLPIGPGRPEVQREHVAQRLRAHLQERGLQCEEELAWQPVEDGVELRLEAHGEDGSSAVVCARVCDDLWLLLDGEPATAAVREALRALCESLQRE